MTTITLEQGKNHIPLMPNWHKFNQPNENGIIENEWKEKKRLFFHNFRQELSENTGWANLPFVGRGVQFVSNGNEQQGRQTITVKKNNISLDFERGKEPRIKDLLDIAQDKGWNSIKIPRNPFVSKEIKAEIWFEASKRGMEVQGYTPSRADEQRLKAYKNNKSEDKDLKITPDLNSQNQQPKQEQNQTQDKKTKNSGENLGDELSEQLKATHISQQEARKIVMAAYEGMPTNTAEYQNAEKQVENSIAAIYNNPTASQSFTRKDAEKMRDSMRGAMLKKMVKDFNSFTQLGMRENSQVKNQGLAEQNLNQANSNKPKNQKQEPPKRKL